MKYEITHRHLKPPFDDWVQARLDRGTEIETLIVMPQLGRDGFEPTGGQNKCVIKSRDGSRVICTGHIDCIIEHAGHRVVVDVKSRHPMFYARVSTAEDMMRDKFGYKQIWQLLLYMYAHEIEIGLFFIDDCLGHQKTIPVYLWDWADKCEEALARCEAVVDAVDANKKLPYCDDPSHCQSCWCMEVGVCSPPLDFAGKGIRILTDEDLSESLERLDELDPAASEHKTLKSRVDTKIKARADGQYLCGEIMVVKETGTTTRYEVPADIKAEYKVKADRVTVKRSRIAGTPKGGDE